MKDINDAARNIREKYDKVFKALKDAEKASKDAELEYNKEIAEIRKICPHTNKTLCTHKVFSWCVCDVCGEIL